ncbi:E4 protein, partial [Phocoena phocoena papillomavirus 1]
LLHLCLAPRAVTSPLYQLLEETRRTRQRTSEGHPKSGQGPMSAGILSQTQTQDQSPTPQHHPHILCTPPRSPTSSGSAATELTSPPPVSVSLTVGVPGAPEITLSFLLS